MSSIAMRSLYLEYFRRGKNHAIRLGENSSSFWYTLNLVVPSPAARAAVAIYCDSLVARPTSLVVYSLLALPSSFPTPAPPPHPYPLGLDLSLDLS